MNARTAEVDRITERAACRTISAGARMTASDTGRLPYRTDPDNLSASLTAAGVVCEANDDLARLIAGKDALPIGASNASRQFIVYDFGADIAAAGAYVLSHRMDPTVRVIAVSPCPSPKEYKAGYQLTPFTEAGVTDGNIETSDSTRTDNLVANTDIAPTIANAFGVTLRTPPFGSPIRSVRPGHLMYNEINVQDLESRTVEQYRAMQALPYIALALAVLIVTGTFFIRRGALPDPWVNAAVTVPLVLCLTFLHVPVAAIIIVCAGLVALTRSRTLNYALPGIPAVAILIDALVFQGRVTGGSMLGYSPIEGARYYGVGNEIMGYWIGATTLFCSRLAENPKWRYAALGLAIAVIVALGLPDAGAKAGGFLVGLLTLGAALWARSGRPIRPWPAAAGVIGALIAGSGLLVLFGRLFGASHVTEAAGMVRSEGISSLVDLIARKAGMDLHLVFHSVWVLVLLASGIASYLALKPIWRRPELPRAEVAGLITATVASFALNDAGVVAGALCSISLWSSAMLLHSRFTRAARAAQQEFPDEPATSLSS